MKYYFFQLKTALRNFGRNKVRTILTSLGIMIGVLSVVLLIALGLGLKNYLKEQFEGLGANLLIVFPGRGFSGEGGFAGGFSSLAGAIQFDEKDYRSLRKVDSADFISPSYQRSVRFEANKENKIGTIQGVNEQYFPMFNLKLMDGKFFDRSDVSASAKVGVMAETLAKDLYGEPQDAVNKIVRVGNLRIKILGVFENIGDPDQDNSLVIPYTTTYGTLNPDKTFFSIFVGVDGDEAVPMVKNQIEDILKGRYDDDQFTVIEPSEILDTVNQIFAIVNGVLVAIGSISLLVGGIGIMNIMYANVTERTKEIGIRRAIGATKRDILFQFLAESVVLSVAGGLAGLVLATLIVLIVRPFFPVAINFTAVALAFGVSSAIGIVFGVFPARRAANLTPIDAIRYE